MTRSMTESGMADRVDCVSIGPACPCAAALHRNAVRVAAYPFDWLVSDARIVSSCLRDGFTKFLDVTRYRHRHGHKDDDDLRWSDYVDGLSCDDDDGDDDDGRATVCRLRTKPSRTRRIMRSIACLGSRRRVDATDVNLRGLDTGGCGHTDLGPGFFRHHCPLCFPQHHAYLTRACRRMMDLFSGDESKPVVFVWMNIFPTGMDRPDEHERLGCEIAAVSDALRRQFWSSSGPDDMRRPWSMVAVMCFEGCATRGAEFVDPEGDRDAVTIVRVRGRSINGGYAYVCPLDNAIVDKVMCLLLSV